VFDGFGITGFGNLGVATQVIDAPLYHPLLSRR
jgi:hypothetical protein